MTTAEQELLALRAQLMAQSLPLVTLDWPEHASLLDAGVDSAGVGLWFADQVASSCIADSSALRLARVRQLMATAPARQPSFRNLSPASALRQQGPVDVLLLSGGFADMRLGDVLDGVRVGGQVALAVPRVPAAAVVLKKRLVSLGLREARVVVPWPSATRVAAWVDVSSETAWSTLQRHYRSPAAGSFRSVLATSWLGAIRRFARTSRWMHEVVAPAFVIGRK